MKYSVTPLILMLSLLSGCGGSEDQATTAQAKTSVEGVSDSEIIIGNVTDLSGPVALIGVAQINGARMRFDEANAAGGIHGRQIRFIVEDSQYQVPRAIQAANKLINRDGVFTMFLSIGTPMNNAVMPLLFEKGIPNLFPASGARSMAEPFRKLQFMGRGIYYDELRTGMSYFVETRAAKTPCVIYQDTDYGQEALDAARDEAAELGLELAAISAHKPTDTEFTAAILRLRGAGCDLVLMGTILKDTTLLLETAHKMGWKDVIWVGNNAAYSVALAELESGASEGYSVFTHMPIIYRDDPGLPAELANWWDRYVAQFQVNPEYYSMEAYINADLVVKALEAAGPDLTREKLISGLESIKDYRNLMGELVSYGPDNHKGTARPILSTVVNGRWHTTKVP